MVIELWTALLLGLVGSLHCAGMCGPLALAMPITGTTPAGFVLGRCVTQVGRLTTYAGLGLIFGLAGQTLLLAGVQRWISMALGAALLVGLLTSRRLALAAPVNRVVGRLQRTMAGRLKARSLTASAALGALNGLLPCGLVYVACAGATATGDLLGGTEYMVAFGLGTVPMMLAIGLSGKLVRPAWRLKLSRLVPVSVALVAALLILRGLSLGIPYVSPDLSASDGGCCHRAADSTAP